MNKADSLAVIRATWRDIAPGQDYEVDFLRPDDAPGVCRLITAIYGDKYPIDDYYIPERIIANNASGDVVTAVARTAAGDVVAQGAIWRTSSPNPNLYEYGQFVVLPEYRQTLVASRLGKFLHHCFDTRPEIHGFFGEAVTNHTITQKIARQDGATPCALEVALMPEGAYAGEGAGGQRVSCLLLASVLRDRRRALHLPQVYRAALAPVVSALAADRDVDFADGAAPAVAAGSMTVQDFAAAGVVRCHALEIGADFPDRSAEIDRQAAADGRAVVQVFLRSDTAAAPWAVSLLRDRGFFLGGLVPLWFGADAVLMQKLSVAPDFAAIHLLSAEATALRDHVLADFRRVA